MEYKLDKLDVRILNYLIENEKLDADKIAAELKTTRKTVYDRLASLKEKKIIDGVYAKINTLNCGYVVSGFILVKLVKGAPVNEVLANYDKNANVTSSFAVAGVYDLVFIVKYKDPEHLSEFLGKIRDDEYVEYADLMYVEKTKREGLCPFPLASDN